MENMPAPPPADYSAEISALATRYRRANGPVMTLVTRIGGSLEGQMAAIPAALRERIEDATARALATSYDLAAQGKNKKTGGLVVGPLFISREQV